MKKNGGKNMFMFWGPEVELTNWVNMFEHTHKNITLKILTSVDIEDFMEWATDDEVTKYMMWDSYNSKADAEDFFKNVVEKHQWFKAICLGNKVIGSITLDKGKGIHGCKAELGYVIARKHWGNGHATEAIKLAIQRGFEDLDIKRIEAYVDPANIGSQRALKKNEFIKEGLLRNYVIHKGVVKDRFIYAFLKPSK